MSYRLSSNAAGLKEPVRAHVLSTKFLITCTVAAVLAEGLILVYKWNFWSAVAFGAFICYLPSYLDSSHLKVHESEGSRYWPAFAHWSGWRKIMSYFPSSIKVENNYDFKSSVAKGGQFVFAVHPHGMLSIDHFLFFTDAVNFLSSICPFPRRDLGASIIFSIPFMRELCLWLGTVDAGASTAHNVLSQGFSMQLFPGGIQEQLATDHTKPSLVAKERTGFIKLALAYDVPIVPVYVFGEDKLFTRMNFLLGFRRMLLRRFRIGWPLFYGRLDRLGLLPEARPLVAIVGEPLWPKGVSRESQERDCNILLRHRKEEASRGRPLAIEPSEKKIAPLELPSGSPAQFRSGRRIPRAVSHEEVNEMMDRYVAALQGIFERNKADQPGYEKATLQILSARG
jgi:1-acyl-sn-glycerol-3-phosphate acyltransferase